MIPLAIACLVIGALIVLLWLAAALSAPIDDTPDWVGGLGVAVFVAGLVFAGLAACEWAGWGVPGWLIGVTALAGGLVIVVSWVGAIGKNAKLRSILTVVGLGIVGAAVVAGIVS